MSNATVVIIENQIQISINVLYISNEVIKFQVFLVTILYNMEIYKM